MTDVEKKALDGELELLDTTTLKVFVSNSLFRVWFDSEKYVAFPRESGFILVKRGLK